MKSRRENIDSHNDSWGVPITILQIIGLFLALSIVIGLFAPNVDSTPPKDETHQENVQEIEHGTLSSNPSEVTTTTNSLTEATSEATFETNFETASTSTSETTESEPQTTESTTVTTEPTVETVPETEVKTETETEAETETPPEPAPSEPEYIGTIYLTFDDGPSTQSTSQILDILQEKGIKATFFIIDYKFGSEREKLVLREFNEGHTIGLHGTSHTYSEIYTSLDALINNFETLQEKVFQSTGYNSTIIRFPGGSSNTVSKHYCPGIMTEAVNYFSNSDFVYFDWNVDSSDAGGAKSIEEVYNNVISGLKPGRNNVVLMHDSNHKEYTIGALAAIIDFALDAGYEFKAITSETPQVTHRVAN